VIAAIYLGQIKYWDDKQITRLNKSAHLTHLAITPFHRTDGSGDTYAFTRYLSDVSHSFATQVGASTTVSFPGGAGAKGNTGMASAVTPNTGTAGAIAYVAVTYVINDKLPAVSIQNAAGNWAVPNLGPIAAAAAAFHTIPSNNEITIVNPPKRAKSAYPISTYTYVIVPSNAPKGTLLKSFISYVLGDGQNLGPRLFFVPLPTAVRNAGLATLNRIS
jgi:phosphate transport system substrate-binding protein